MRSSTGVPGAANRRLAACGFFLRIFGRWPTSRRVEAGRCPAGRHRMSEFAQASPDRRPNFNCELIKCSGRWRISRR